MFQQSFVFFFLKQTQPIVIHLQLIITNQLSTKLYNFWSKIQGDDRFIHVFGNLNPKPLFSPVQVYIPIRKFNIQSTPLPTPTLDSNSAPIWNSSLLSLVPLSQLCLYTTHFRTVYCMLLGFPKFQLSHNMPRWPNLKVVMILPFITGIRLLISVSYFIISVSKRVHRLNVLWYTLI